MNKFVIIAGFVGVLLLVMVLIFSNFFKPASQKQPPSVPVGSAIPTVIPSPASSQLPSNVTTTRPDPSAIDTYFQSIKQSNPDVFVHSKTPYSNDLFSIQDKSFTVSPTLKYSFLVTLKGADKKADQDSLKKWLQSLGLTDIQIQNLDITYQ